MAGDEVRVKVGEEDVADLEAKLLGIGQVLLGIALGVDDDGGRAGLISEQIRSVGKAAQVVLFKNHRNLYCLPQRGPRYKSMREDVMIFARDRQLELLWFRDDAEVGFQRLPAARIFLVRFVVRHGGNDDDVLA